MELNKNKWKEFSTATVSDALDRLGLKNQCLNLKPLKRGLQICGLAYTVLYEDQLDGTGTVGDYIEKIEMESVVVIDNSGRRDATVWGDILTQYSLTKNLEGTVINGVCRDSSCSLKLGYPIFSLGTYMRTGKARVRFKSENIPLHINGVSINPGDMIFGDDDGIVVIPKASFSQVYKVALDIKNAESNIMDAIKRGITLQDARTEFKYHSLQSKQE